MTVQRNSSIDIDAEVEKLLSGSIKISPTSTKAGDNSQPSSAAEKVELGHTAQPEPGASYASSTWSTSFPSVDLRNGMFEAHGGVRDATVSELLTQKNYHPVLLFGSAAVGKSTLLVSLLTFANHHKGSPSISTFNDQFFEIENASTEALKKRASRLFFKDTWEFQKGNMPERTQAEAPIFIPVDLTPKQQGSELSIAFLESAGEHQKADEETGQARDNSFSREVQSIFRTFQGGLSIILVAPYSLGQSRHEMLDDVPEPSDSLEMSNADQALYLSMANYARMRPKEFKKNDRFLFLLTKWDEHTSGPNSEDFLHPSPSLVDQQLARKFPSSWNFFLGMREVSAYRSMHYSAGVIANNIRLTSPDEFDSAFGEFPREVWRWIYVNAAAARRQGATVAPRGGLLSRLFFGAR